MNYKFSPKAEADLIKIHKYIASNNPIAARKFLNKIFKNLELVSSNPLLGHGEMISPPRIIDFSQLTKDF